MADVTPEESQAGSPAPEEQADRPPQRPRVLWLSGLVLGAADGLAILLAGSIGVALVALTIALIAVRGPRLFAAAGFASGFGGSWTAVLLRVKLDCAATNALPGQSCGTGSNDLWLVGAAALLAARDRRLRARVPEAPSRRLRRCSGEPADQRVSQVSGRPTHSPSATPTATKSGMPQSMSTSHEAIRCVAVPTAKVEDQLLAVEVDRTLAGERGATSIAV